MESVLKINQNSPSRAAAFLAAPLYWLCSLRSPWRRKPKMSPPLSGDSVRQVWAKKGPPQGRTVVKTSAAANEKRRNSWFNRLTLENDDVWDEGSQPTTISPQLNDWATG